MSDECGNASSVSVAKVIERRWRKYFVVLGVDPYRDRAELSYFFEFPFYDTCIGAER